MGASYARDYPMNVNFNGRASRTQGKQPKKPVRWSGKFLVVDARGNALESQWLPNSGGLMTYTEAREAALNLINSLTAMLYADHKQPIKKVTFNLVSR
ncbi:hypothetical protein AB4P95_29740 (plasmid) [Pseudomonas sp. A1437]|uniref:hypothetical protein n=1 Tax=Pseudomonas sp. A1437 TaxID=3235107 RepID=UPI0037852B5F